MTAAPSTDAGLSTAIERYCSTYIYERDLAAVRAVWGPPGVLETAGSFTLLTYFALPKLLAVQAAGEDGEPRLAIDGHRERRFLAGLLGLTDAPELAGGIRNPLVRHRARMLTVRHSALPGMTGRYMEFVGALLAVAPLRARGEASPVRLPVRRRYWRYMRHAMLLFDVSLGSGPRVARATARFARRGAGRSRIGDELIRYYHTRHPDHTARALPTLHAPTRGVVLAALGMTDD